MARLKLLSELRPLARLRLAFVGLGIILLAPLGLLLNAASERLDAQRRLRHEVVSDRIFDELERELTELLERESQRPSEAYYQQSLPDTWAPFILGYFTARGANHRLVSDQEIDQERRTKLERAIDTWQLAQIDKGEEHEAVDNGTSGSLLRQKAEQKSGDSSKNSQKRSAAPRSAMMPASQQESSESAAAPKSSPEVLRQLNRANDARRKARPAKKADPLQDYSAY